MGRWDEGKKPGKSKNLPKLIKKIIYIGFIIVAVVILAVFIPRAGLNVELLHRGGEIETISTKISNNNFSLYIILLFNLIMGKPKTLEI